MHSAMLCGDKPSDYQCDLQHKFRPHHPQHTDAPLIQSPPSHEEQARLNWHILDWALHSQYGHASSSYVNRFRLWRLHSTNTIHSQTRSERIGFYGTSESPIPLCFVQTCPSHTLLSSECSDCATGTPIQATLARYKPQILEEQAHLALLRATATG